MASTNANGSVPIALALGGVAAVMVLAGISGNSIASVFEGKVKSPADTGPNAGSSSGTPAYTYVPNTNNPLTGGLTSPITTAGQVGASGSSPAPIVNMINWCNEVAGQYDYTWGGGHGQIGQPSAGPCNSSGQGSCFGFDCSGAVSGALGAAGFLSSPMTAEMFGTWGAKGKGQYVTIYSNFFHCFMLIEGHWFGTGKLGIGGGVDWGNFDPNLLAYTATHPPGF
ncbi:MAG: hypothetical protein ABSF18_07675 [Gammaproteobacteria bacterium]|jgi:hypothetical protein